MKTSLDQFFKTDDNEEKNGKWFVLQNEGDGKKEISFLMRPFKATNPRVKAAVAAHHKPYARQIEAGTLDIKKALEIKIKLWATVSLVDWKGVDIDGTEVPASIENAVKVFSNLPDGFDILWGYVNDFNNYKIEETQDVGNS